VSAAASVLVDGVAARTVDVEDRGLHFGDGVFETIACPGGRPRFLDLHLARLERGCRALRLGFDHVHALAAEVSALAAGNESCLVKAIVTRGRAVVRGYGFTGTERPTRIVMRYAWPAGTERHARDGIDVRLAITRVGESPALAGIKHLNRLEQVLARGECPVAEVAELLMLDASGRLAGGTMSNVFVVVRGVLQTPSLERCGIAGVMRHVVLREAGRTGLHVDVREIEAGALHVADEAFVTNARIGVWPVRSVEGRALGIGPVTRRVQDMLAPLLEGGARG
jgi:4-amino-4-deoxychorismate lyase